MVAAGGSGGANGSNHSGSGRAGGGLYGTIGMTNSINDSNITYGSQILGGKNGDFPSANGGFGYGGDAHVGSYNGGGGGGGYYGGAGGRGDSWSSVGSSGSSYISGHIGCNSILEQSMSNNIMHSGSGYHYGGKYFINTVMIDGYGYKWNSFKEGQVNMPTHDGKSTMTGNSGNGYAKITLKSINVVEQEDINQYKFERPFVAYYEYSGSYQQLKIEKTGNYKIELWGAQGASYGTTGGFGSYTKGQIHLSSGDTLYVYVGGQGSGKTGGWNGGGNGSYSSNGYAAGGGGSTDIRLVPTSASEPWNEFESLKSRIMVAAGGSGGANGSSYYANGRSGGGLYGTIGMTNMADDSNIIYGTQFSGGKNTKFPSANGSFGYGGDAHVGSYNGGGGGGGYYGGAGGRSDSWGSSGSSGSSYISGHAGCVAITSAGLPKAETYTTLADSIHYTNMKFTNTTMVDGYGYQWTTVKGNAVFYMPSYDEKSTMTGHSGNGYAKITYLGQ